MKTINARLGCVFLGSLLLSLAAHSQQPTFNTLAGYPGQGSADGNGGNARFNNPSGVAVDSTGNVFVADTANHTIRQITPAGVASTLAGSPGVSGSADGTGAAAQFSQPQGVAVDSAGNVYVADTGNHTIRQITPAGVVSTLAGLAGVSGSANGTGTGARFYQPEGLAVDSATNVYVADTWNHTIRMITPAGAVSTLAGSAGSYGSADGTGSAAQFYQPQGVAVDSAGIVYIADTGNQTVRKITTGAVVSTLAGFAGIYGSVDGTGTNAHFYGPAGVAVDGSGIVYVADYFSQTIRKVTPAGVVSTLAGLAGNFGSADGTNSAARFWNPAGVAASGTTNVTVYVADAANSTIRTLTPAGANWVSGTLAGSASTGSADATTGGEARFYWPAGVAVDVGGNVFVADTQNGTIRKVTTAGAVSTLAGSAGNYGGADGTGTNAQFYGPQGVAMDTAGVVYVADTVNATIRKITSGGTVSTLAGTAGSYGIANGSGNAAQFYEPQGLTVDSSGNVYVADTWNHTIRKITAAGVVTTLAGLPGNPGCIDGTGSNVGTNTARFNAPGAVAVDQSANVFVADTWNHTIRKVTAAGVVTTLAGLPGVWGNTDGTNSAARFYAPAGIAVDSATNIYVLDSGNHTIRKLVPAGANWVVSTVAGVPDVSGSADGAATNALFCYPMGLAVDSATNLYVADTGNNTIRRGASIGSGPPIITGQPHNQTVNQGGSATFTVTVTGVSPLYYQWRWYGTNLSGATGSSYTRANVQPSDAGPYSVVVSNALGTLTSADAVLTVIVPPTITTQPQSQTVTQGVDVTFTTAASGTAPFTYQWQLNSVSISGATASSYARTNVQQNDGGDYSVVVSNQAGSATSSNATLTVIIPPTPPSITTQPQNQTVNQGASANFSVAANGSTPLYYQWSLYGTNLGGATGSSYTRANAQPADAGPYSVVVSNTLGIAVSSNALLTVIAPPAITTQPQSQTVTQGTSATFTVAASGTTPFSFQWRLSGTNVSGATASSYTRTNAQLADAGNYSVVATNPAGSATSSNATLTVVAPPGITAQPQSLVVNQGNNATFTVTATGSAPLYYQWQWYGTNLAGATATSLPLTAVSTNQSGPYTVVVTNTYGAATSQVATLTVTTAFQAGGMYPLWKLAPGSRPYLTTNSLPNERGMAYNAVNGHLLVVSRTTPSVYVLDAATGADLNQLSVSGISGGTYTLLLIGVADDGVVYAGNLTTASSTTSFTLYRWANDSASAMPTVAYTGNPTSGNSERYGDTLDVRGAGTNTQVILASRSSTNVVILTTTDGAAFTAKSVVVADATAGGFGLGIAFGPTNTFWGKATSAALRQVTYNFAAGTGSSAHVYTNPVIPNAVGPIGVNTQFNLMAGINVGASGNHLRLYDLSPTLTNGAPGLIATNAFATDNDNSGTGTGAVDFGPYTVYALCANNGLMALQITQAVVNLPPGIASQPQDQNLNAGQSASFTVNATGTAPLSYQWRFNSTNLTGATASAYTRTNAQPTDAGNYSVIVTNIAGTITSSNAVLTVNVPPAINAQPQNQTINQGGAATFTVAATGAPAPAYQWLFNGTNLAGATTSAYTRSNAQPTDAGAYSVLVTNVAGNVTSSNATLTVNVPPVITTQPQSQTNLAGSSVTFSVSATGTEPLTYWWQYNGTPYPPGTNTLMANQAGSYSVIISNMAGGVMSDTATLTLTNPPPAQPGHFDGLTLLPDGSLQLAMSGTPGTNYVLEYTSDWAAWTNLAVLSGTDGQFQYSDPAVTNTDQRFYRLKLAP